MRPFLTVYGAGIGGTFVWLFFAMSGTSACAAVGRSCQSVLGLSGQMALTWPAYWGGRLTGESIVIPLISADIVAVAALVFGAVVLFAKVYAQFGPTTAAPDEPDQTGIVVPGSRRDQSAVSPGA